MNQNEKNNEQPNFNQHPTQSLSPPLRTIRRSFELLSISFFLNIFGSILSIQDFSISKLEADLDGSLPDSYAPNLILKLIVALTGDRTTNHTNWESRLRREFLRREPNENPLGEDPAKLKPKLPKRAVGYVYIAEPILPSSRPSIAQLNSHTTQPDSACYDPSSSWVPTSQPLHTPVQPSVNPQTHSLSDQPLNLPVGSLPQDSLLPSKNLHPSSNNQPLPMIRQSNSSDLTPFLNTLHQDQNLSESIQPKQSPLDSTKSPSPAAQHSNNESGSTKTWSSLSPTVKLKALFKLCEWHFSTSHDLERFRRLVDLKAYSTGGTVPDERFDWRQERCGIDSLGNQYWLSGQGIEARLWIQRQEPQPPRKSITLRIPARTSNKGKGATLKDQKRRRSFQVPNPVSSSTLNTRRSSHLDPIASKRPRLAGTRSSMRLRASQPHSPPTNPAPLRPPTVIVIKKSTLFQKSETPQPAAQRINNRSSRPSPRHRAREEVWQDVPPGWLEEVVEPTSNAGSLPPFSSDLSDMSDDDDQVEIEHTTAPSNSSIPENPKSIAAESEPNNNNAFMMDESLSELTESQDASTVVTCESLSSHLDASDSEMNQIVEVNRESIEKNASIRSREHVHPLTRTSGDGDVMLAKGVDKLKCLDAMQSTTTVPSNMAENQTIFANGELPIGSSLNNKTSEKTPPPDGNDQIVHQDKLPTGTSGSADPTPQSEQNSVTCSIDQQIPHSAALDRTDSLTTSVKDFSESPPLGDCPSVVKSACDEASNFLYPEMKGHPLDPEWIEWEVICSNLNEWKEFSLQFQHSECQSEKKLNDHINREVLPHLKEAYEAEETRIQQEEAMALRKRSTRLTAKEVGAQPMNFIDSEMLLRENTRMHSSRLEAKRLRELEMEEIKKQQKEDEERLNRSKERGERSTLKETQPGVEKDTELTRTERARLRAEMKLSGNAVKVAQGGAENSVLSIDSDQQWKLNCEICGATGFNMDDGSEVICCDQCEDWQHLYCHDKADEILKRPKRDWRTSDFTCSNCSGVPIPRAVAKLRNHLNVGRAKIKPRSSSSRVLKDDNNFNEMTNIDSSSSVSPVGNSSHHPVKSHKLTILMSNPNKHGGTSLSQAFSNELVVDEQKPSDFAKEHEQVSSQLDNQDGIEGDQRSMQNLTNDKKVSETPLGIQATSAYLAPPPTPTIKKSVTNPISVAPTDLSMYYNDLEKLRGILKANTHLHRSLPTDVMKRLRNYLIDQQKLQQHNQKTRDQDQIDLKNKNDNVKKRESSSSLINQARSHPSQDDHVQRQSFNPVSSTQSVSINQDEQNSSSIPLPAAHVTTHRSSDPSDSALSLPSVDADLTPLGSTFIHPQFP